MSIAPVQAAGSGASQALQQMAQASNQASNAPQTSATQMPASAEMSAQTSQSTSGTGFTDSVLDTVFTEIDKLSSKVPAAASSESAVGTFKGNMASKSENISPVMETGTKDAKNEAVTALSKTFDHAVFMAMVNQVVSGVSDTSRTLIRQS